MSLEHAPERQGVAMGILDEYATREDLAKELGIGIRTLARYDAMREGPPRLMLAGRVLYHRPGAREWLKARLTEQVDA